MIYKNFKNIKLSCLGMGNMRLPVKDDNSHNIDYEKASEIIDYAINNGINYFDTAYVYHGGNSERFLGECLINKYPRDTFYVTDKFFILADPDYKKVFEEQLKRLNTDHIDFYLIHSLTDGTTDKYINSGAIEFFEEMKRQGKITYLGFSSHADPKYLKRFAELRDWDFIQIQLNYFDWLYGTAKEEYEIVTSLNIPVMVMESVRGGRLSKLTPSSEAKLKALHPDWSISSWAFRWLLSLDNVQVCLSGMTTIDQIEDNVKTFSDLKPLNKEEIEVLYEACKEFKKQLTVPCTGCRYCTDGCPKKINIPAYLDLFNKYKFDTWALDDYDTIESVGKPSDCINCKKCTTHCPQSINIPQILKELSEAISKTQK